MVPLATLMGDGPPQVQPVWCSFDGTHILVNTAKGRQNIDALARLYLGVDKYPFHQEGDVRGVLFKIAPQRVATVESTMPDFSAST